MEDSYAVQVIALTVVGTFLLIGVVGIGVMIGSHWRVINRKRYTIYRK